MDHNEQDINYLKTLTALHVEDDHETRTLMRHIIGKRVGTLFEADNGASGLTSFIDNRPDIIITDVMMPIMDGLAMAQQIRELDPSVPIIVTTAFGHADHLMQAIDIGIDKYVTKPMNTERLRRALLECARKLRSEQELKLAAKVFDNSLEAILITDASARILSVNHSFSLVTGYTAAEAIGQKPSIMASGKHDKAFYEAMWDDIINHGCWQGEITNRRKDGTLFPEWLSITTLFDNHKRLTHCIGIFTDISERKASEEQIRHLALHDALTGLPNRRLLMARLEVALAGAKRNGEQLGVLFIDLDNLKTINDNHGHHVGDLVLKEVARRLLCLFRASDTVSRLGGDEFVVVVNSLGSADDAGFAAQRIIAAMADTVLTDEGNQLNLSASIGIALYPDDSASMETLIRQADNAMYAIKHRGKNNYCFFSQTATGPATPSL